MITHSAARIYLSDQRGLIESDRFRTYSTFNFGEYFNEHRLPFGDLYLLNDDSLAGGQSITMNMQDSSCLILVPIVGAVSYHDSLGNENLVNAGEIQILFTNNDYSVELANPYEKNLVNFLQIWVKTRNRSTAIVPQVFNTAINKSRNSLVRVLPVFDQLQDDFLCKPPLAIGKFNGRNEAVYKKTKAANGVFVFVIEGAFEVQGRLLHPRDGLSLSGGENEIELEALSNDAIILLLEVSL